MLVLGCPSNLVIPAPGSGLGQHTELDLRHIQISAVLGSVVKLQPPLYAPGILRRECLVQRRLAMGAQVVQDHLDYRRIGVGLIH